MSLQNQFEKFNDNIRLSSKKLDELKDSGTRIFNKKGIKV